MTDLEIQAAKELSIDKVRSECKAWLRDRAYWFKGQTTAGLMKRLSEYRETLTPESKPEGTEWARLIHSRVLDGKPVHITAAKFAQEAMININRRNPINRRPHSPLTE